jgi:general secretion pathway protein I
MWVLKSNGLLSDRSSISRGFTLIEVIAAMSIMAIVLLAVYRLHAQTISMNGAVRFYTIAPLLAQIRLSAIDTDPEGRDSGSGDFGPDFPGYAWEVTIEDTASEYLGETAANLKKIDIVISLNENESTYRVRTYRLMPDKG